MAKLGMNVVDLRNVSFRYTGSEKEVLSNISLKIEEGESVLITGPSGCGKSTIARIIMGLIPHSYSGDLRGEAYVFGMNILENPVSRIATRCGIVFQNPANQLFTFSVEDDVAFGPENLALPPEDIRRRVDESIRLVGIEHLRYSSPNSLSGGEQQKAAIASILSMHPSIIVFDEPTSMLDPSSSISLIQSIFRLKENLEEKGSKITLIIIEHRISLLLDHVSRIVVISDGRIVLDGEPMTVLYESFKKRIPINIPPVLQIYFRIKDKCGLEKPPKNLKELFSYLREEVKHG
ncbi:MAG: energy-coupling factor ABC transporter ATP-binding protein [Crenarchaeota archaeon]|nr:energy-coupling factor ABC transporter ATP-binding protein [Thermoproteota archaeon]MDW8033371.1 ABC transporter ATP-binding protein [Nitrososphaerota archaeon]